jgi:hypothetical protein
MNALLHFRLLAIDRRLPLAGSLLTGSLAAVPTLPSAAASVILWAVPAGAVWLLANAVAHARSKEDHLHRIAELEEMVNRLAGQPLMQFQSRHPSRGRFVAGRSGQSSLAGVAAAATAWLVGATYMAGESATLMPAARYGFAAYVISAGVMQVLVLHRLMRYRSQRRHWLDSRDSA